LPVARGETESSRSIVPVIRPTLPDMDEVMRVVLESYRSGRVTLGEVTNALEGEVQRFCDVAHAVAVSSCTSGLMLVLAAMGFSEGDEVIMPSFTFAATAQAILWNRLTPVFVDCLPGTMTIDPGEVRRSIGGRTVAICPVTVFGLPPDLGELEEISSKTGLPLICDSAQGLGSSYGGRPAGGFGCAEVFSLSPTKVVTAIEGGMITTDDGELAGKLRSMRDYGKGPGGDEMIYNGLSARMSELHAAIGLLSLRNADELIRLRMRLIGRYRRFAATLPGCAVQQFPGDRTTNGNYFTILVGESAKRDRDASFAALARAGIESKRYFFPPVHAQKIVADRPHRIVGELPNTWAASRASLALPLYSHMTEQQQDRVCDALGKALR
jgi:dTDP-4-amino-4,6-dideoxygalactose transaminase